jgi:hypothetical protein
MYGVMLVSAAFLLGWLLWLKREVRREAATAIHYAQLGLLTLTVVLDHIDNEVMRFMGIHLTASLFQTYHRVDAWGPDMFHIFATDRGGPWIPFVILLASMAVMWWAGRRIIHRGRALPLLWRWPVAIMASLLPLIPPYVMHEYHGKGYRQRRTQPAIMTLYAEFDQNLAMGNRPPRFEVLAREYQARWLQNSGDTAWRFTDPERPLVRVPLTPAIPVEGKPWNVIYIQLETFRGWDTGHLRPDVATSATPYLDRLAHDSASAFWRRHLSMGGPTVSSFIAGLCSTKPHSTQDVTTRFTYTMFKCLPTMLRRHGYVAEYFTGSDPDWDGKRFWLRDWYDEQHYYIDIGYDDRAMFRRSAERIRELGRGPRPFIAAVTSISNHYPFRSREPQFNIDPPDRPREAIRNTMRYTDDVVRDFVELLQNEPWFARTLIVVVGDHGYNLGEHGAGGISTGWRESVWVPLVIHGAHPRLPRGGHDGLATLLDVAPTISDLLGIREPNPWMGSSLVVQRPESRTFALIRRSSATWGEQGRFSMVVDPVNGRARLFDVLQDPLQRKDISAQHRDVVTALQRIAEDERDLTNYLLETNRVWKEPTNAPSVAEGAARASINRKQPPTRMMQSRVP